MLLAGTRVGPYEIVSWLGAGGMGEVYRARDTKLLREVALKTLPEDLAGHPERLARLKQEARILASLNHPGIATLHGLEDTDGVPVLVMELVEGESLADRLRRGPLPVGEAMAVAQQIALALEAAHEKGVLHRDLKPANIRMAKDGRVKLLDFGLARAVRAMALDSRLDTETSPHSEPGAVLGTAPYMSPEQARGQEVDRRGDVWSFGCVIFEMLAGKRAFGGATFSDTVVAVLEHEPDWPALPPGTPPAVLRLLRRCLQKDKDKRLRDVADARLELEDILAGPAPPAEASREPRRSARGPTIAVVSALLGGAVWWMLQRPPSVPERVVRFPVEVSGEMRPLVNLAVSPRGERIAYGTMSGLVVRELDKSEGRAIPGTASAIGPFFSPNGDWLGFTEREGILKKVSSTGGVPITVCKVCGVENSFGASWGPDDSIVFTPDSSSGLWQVSAGGGEPRELTKPDRTRGERSHRWPQYLPGGKAVLFTVGTSRLATWDDARIEAVVLRTGERRTILEGGTGAAYVESGHLVYRRGASILAAPFDIGRLAMTGAPVAVVEGVKSPSIFGNRLFTVARTGLLAYVPEARGTHRLVLVDRTGAARALTPYFESLRSPRVSPDGGAIAFQRQAANDQVWRFDIEREAVSQVTFEWDNLNPVWTPDGESLIVSSSPGGRLHRLRADGSGTPEPLAGGSNRYPHSMTPDGRLLAFMEGGTNTGLDIWIMPLESGGAPRVLLQTPANEAFPAISPDGHSLAYQSDESGQDEVYLRPFPDGGSKIQVSSGGGNLPVWARNGRELFYYVPLEDAKRRMMVVDVSPGHPVRISKGRALFDKSFGHIYDVLPNGQQFAMIETDPEARVTHFNVVLNWFEELKRLVPPK